MKIKKVLGLSVCTVVLILAVSCGQNENRTGKGTADEQNKVQRVLDRDRSEADISSETKEGFVDLTALSSTMVYSEVYNMMSYPENYVGKTIKMSGTYDVYHDENTDKYYHACIISDATACCAQGIEFELTEDYIYPEDYPNAGGQICVEGVFDTYKEGEYAYCTLRNSRILN